MALTTSSSLLPVESAMQHFPIAPDTAAPHLSSCISSISNPQLTATGEAAAPRLSKLLHLTQRKTSSKREHPAHVTTTEQPSSALSTRVRSPSRASTISSKLHLFRGSSSSSRRAISEVDATRPQIATLDSLPVLVGAGDEHHQLPIPNSPPASPKLAANPSKNPSHRPAPPPRNGIFRPAPRRAVSEQVHPASPPTAVIPPPSTGRHALMHEARQQQVEENAAFFHNLQQQQRHRPSEPRSRVIKENRRFSLDLSGRSHLSLDQHFAPASGHAHPARRSIDAVSR